MSKIARIRASGALRTAIPMLVVAVLAAGASDVDAKGGRRSSGSSAGKSHGSEPGADSSGLRPSVNLRSSSSSSSPSPSSAAEDSPVAHAGERSSGNPAPSSAPVLDAEEEARRAANQAIFQRQQAEKAAAAKLAAEKAEADRVAAERAAAARAAQAAAEQRAAAARAAAALEKKRVEQAAVAADVERVLQRARADYPVLSTAQGEPVMRKIMDRQQALVARGAYPSVAMVEAISDHAHALAPRRQQELQIVAGDTARPVQSTTLNGCRWVNSIKWSCD